MVRIFFPPYPCWKPNQNSNVSHLMSPVKRGKIGWPNWQNCLARSNLMLRLVWLKKARGEEICKEDKFHDSYLLVPSFTKLSLILMIGREKHQAYTFWYVEIQLENTWYHTFSDITKHLQISSILCWKFQNNDTERFTTFSVLLQRETFNSEQHWRQEKM